MLSLLAALALAAPVPDPGPEWVTLKGRVAWPDKKKIPEPALIDVSDLRAGDADYLRKGPAEYDDRYGIDEKTRGMKGVVVRLRPDDDDPKKTFPLDKVHPDLAKPKAKTHTVTNEFCRFDKRWLVLRAGDSVEWVNKGPVHLAVRAEVFDGESYFNSMPPGKDPVTTQFKTAGGGVFVDSMHDFKQLNWLPGSGRIIVFDHPYFAVTNENGEFELKDVPRGRWRIVCQTLGGYHKGKDGVLGLPVDVKGDKKGEMTLDAVQYETPKAK
jgi:hypothetical protein